MKTTNVDVLDVPPQRVIALLCAERFLVPAHEAREDVAAARFERVRDDEASCEVVVHIEQYRRKKTGGLDRGATDPTTMRYRLRRPDGPVDWSYGGPDPRIRIAGTTHVEPHGDGCRVIEDAQIDVRLPLIGRMIARVIARGIDATFEGNKPLVRRLLAD